MKYQSEYQRSYQKRTPIRSHEFSAEERRLNEVPIKRSPSRRRPRSVPNRNNHNENFAVIGPNDKFSASQLYRLREPLNAYPRVRKSQEYALLGRNEKLENNVTYPLRKPVISDSPRVVVRRRKHDNHSCGIQTDLAKTPQKKRDVDAIRKRNTPLSEYKDRYNWRKSTDEQLFNEYSKPREQQRSEPQVSTSVAVNTPARVEIDVNKTKPQVNQKKKTKSPVKPFRPKRDETTEYRTRYTPKFKPQKAYEAEQIYEQKPRAYEKPERAYSDDEGVSKNVDLGYEFRTKYPHGKLRRWKSEYQSTYKPFWRFDYKDGKWYKDSAADEKGFNPNLFWYKELMSTRKRADEYRANAEEDHFNPNHTLQLQTGFNINNNYRAWDTDNDDDNESVISIDRDLEKERVEGERRREKDAHRISPKKEQPKPKPLPKRKTDQIAQTEHQTDRVIYIDDPPPRQPSSATKAFVRNLGSSSVQQHMSWDLDSLNTQRTNSDLSSHRKYHNNIIHASKKVGTSSPLSTERQPKNGYSSPKGNPETNRTTIYPSASYEEPSRTIIQPSYQEPTRATVKPSYQEPTRATGQPSYDRRPYTSTSQYCTYPVSRFKDEVTEYYYGDDDDHRYTPVSKPSFPRYDRAYKKDDDVLSVNSARSLSSSCSLASQTLERAQENMNKYWNENSSSSPKKPYSNKH